MSVSRDARGRVRAVSGKMTHPGHQDVLAAEAVVRVGVVEVDGGDGDVGVGADVGHGGDLGLGLEARHEATRDARDDFSSVG